MLRTLAGLILGGLVLAEPAAAQATDTVLVTLGAESVEVVQRLAPDGEAVRAFALRLDGQTLEMVDVVREGESLLDAVLTEGGRTYRLDVVSGAPLTVRYRVGGSTERIPLFATGGRAELTVVREVERPYLIRLQGDPARLAALDLATSLPRFTRLVPGAAEVAVSSLPALVRLSPGGPFTFTRIADTLALIAILIAAVWTWRQGRAADRREDRAADRREDRAADRREDRATDRPPSTAP